MTHVTSSTASHDTCKFWNTVVKRNCVLFWLRSLLAWYMFYKNWRRNWCLTTILAIAWDLDSYHIGNLADPEGTGTGGFGSPSPLKIKNIGFLKLAILFRIPWKSQSYQENIQWWPANSGYIWILHTLFTLKNLNHKNYKNKSCQRRTTSDETFWIRVWLAAAQISQWIHTSTCRLHSSYT